MGVSKNLTPCHEVLEIVCNSTNNNHKPLSRGTYFCRDLSNNELITGLYVINIQNGGISNLIKCKG